MDNGSLDKLSDAFDSNFEAETSAALEEIKCEIAEIDNKKNDIVEQSKDLMLHDQEFIRGELKVLMNGARNVLSKLESDIKIGSAPRTYEVYARLLEAVTGQYRELRELNKDIANIAIERGKLNIGDMRSGDTIALKPEQLLDIIESAKEKSQMDSIEVDFKIEDSRGK